MTVKQSIGRLEDVHHHLKAIVPRVAQICHQTEHAFGYLVNADHRHMGGLMPVPPPAL